MADTKQEDIWTVGRILTWTTDYLKKQGAGNPRLDAEVLLAHALQKSRIQLYTMYETPLSEGQRATMRGLVKRRAAHEPVAYLVGHKEFFSLDFEVNQAVLVPRPETEILVMHAIEIARESYHDKPLSVIDLCTGSGCIAISVANTLPRATLVATDISTEALEVAVRNAKKHQVLERIDFRQGDLFGALAVHETCDLLISNPPYILTKDLEGLEPDVREHEPIQALDGGSDGLAIISTILRQAPKHINPGGFLLMEMTPELREPIDQLLKTSGAYGKTEWIKDYSGQIRHLRARLAV